MRLDAGLRWSRRDPGERHPRRRLSDVPPCPLVSPNWYLRVAVAVVDAAFNSHDNEHTSQTPSPQIVLAIYRNESTITPRGYDRLTHLYRLQSRDVYRVKSSSQCR